MLGFERSFDYDSSYHWQTTEDLKSDIGTHRMQNPAGGLSLKLVNRIIDWKLRNQRHRTEKHRQLLTAAIWMGVTECAFSVKHTDADILASVQLSLLAALPGVGAGLGSAILALTFPEDHGVIDFRVWKVIFATEKRSFTPKDYVTYLRELRPLAQETGWSVQKADFMVWSAYDELTKPSTRTRRKATKS